MDTKCITKTIIATVLLTAAAHGVSAATYPYDGSSLAVSQFHSRVTYSEYAEMVSDDRYAFTATSN